MAALMRRARLFFLAAAAVPLALVLSALLPGPDVEADLEVTIPPGTPHEWWRELPDRQPRWRQVAVAKEEKPKEKPKEEKGTTVREREKVSTEVRAQPELGSGTYQPMIFSGVLTVDLPFHTPWTKRPGGEPKERTYPPPVTDDLYWTAQTAYLRRLLHPAMVPESEIYWYLVMVGDPAREAAAGAKQEKFLEPLATAIDKAIEKLPEKPPEPPAVGDDPEQKMIARLACDDLSSAEAYTLDPTYAGGILSLGAEGLPAVLACAASDHPLLRRNAAALLGGYTEDEATGALRKIYREDKDAVARTRALFHLVRRKDEQIVPDLLKALEQTDDKRLRPLAAFSLGMIGAASAVAPLAKAIEENPDDWDLIVAATVALARTARPKEDAEAIATLRKLEQSLRGPEPRFREMKLVDRPAADIPDIPEVKNRMLLELATCALAKLGDKEGRARLGQILEGKYEDPKRPVGHANASGPERQSQCDALKWVCPSTHEILVDTLGTLGPEGAARLKQIIQHVKTNERLRVAALKQEPIAKDRRFLGEIALGSDSAALRGLALRLLFNQDEKAGLKAAENVLALYASGKDMSKLNPKGDVSVITALELLFRGKKIKGAEPLGPVIVRAMKEYEYVKPDVTAEGMKPFRFSPPILETACWMIGATGDRDGIPLLKKVLSEKRLGGARAEAALALGAIGDKASVDILVELLDDDDGWLRYNAYLALRNALKGLAPAEGGFADWLYGPKSERDEAAAKWREAAKKKK